MHFTTLETNIKLPFLLGAWKTHRALPDDVIFRHLRRSGLCGRRILHLEIFLSEKNFPINIPGKLRSPQTLSQGVPEGSVLSPLIFNFPIQIDFICSKKSMRQAKKNSTDLLWGSLGLYVLTEQWKRNCKTLIFTTRKKKAQIFKQ